MATHEQSLKSAKRAISKILQGQAGRFYVAKTAGRDPDWLFITAAPKDTAAETSLAGAVKDADTLGAHKPACGVVTADGGKIQFTLGKVKSFRPKLAAGPLKAALKGIQKSKGMSFLGKVAITAGGGEGGEAPEIISEGEELTEAEMIGIFVDDGIPLLVAQELVEDRQLLLRDLREIELFELDIFAPDSLIEPMLIEARETVQAQEDAMYAEADLLLEQRAALAAYLAASEATSTHARQLAGGGFAYTARSLHQNKPLLRLALSEVEAREVIERWSADGARIASGQFRWNPEKEHRKYLYVTQPMVRRIETELKRVGAIRTVVYTATLDDAGADAALQKRKNELVQAAFDADSSTGKILRGDDTLLMTDPLLSETFFAYMEVVERSPENLALLKEVPALQKELDTGSLESFDSFYDRLISESAPLDLNVGFALRAEFTQARNREAPFTETLADGSPNPAFRSLITKLAKEFTVSMTEQIHRFTGMIMDSYENQMALQEREKVLVAAFVDENGDAPSPEQREELCVSDERYRTLSRRAEMTDQHQHLYAHFAKLKGLDVPTL